MPTSTADQPIVLPPTADVRAVSAQLVALVRGLLLGAAAAGLDAGAQLIATGEVGPRALYTGVGFAALRFLVEGFVLDREAPASATPLGGAVAEPAKAQIVAQGIEDLAAVADTPTPITPEVVRAAVVAAMPRDSTATRRRVAAAVVDALAHPD